MGNESGATAGAAAPALFDPAIAGITRLSAVDTVRARMALAIQLGLLGAGEQVPPDVEVAQAMGVSAITARRALKSLADDAVERGAHLWRIRHPPPLSTR